MSKTSPAVHVLIAAAGSGERMTSFDVPKQYIPLCGKAILRHTVEKFISIDAIQSINILINPEHKNHYSEALIGIKDVRTIKGSKTRKNSIYNGLKEILKVKNDDIILIHDAARPLIAREDIKKAIEAAVENGASSVAHKVNDTLYSNQESNTVDRTHLWAIQPPQVFRYDIIKKAHEELANDDSFTDDRGMVEAIGHKVTLVEGSQENIKITTENDLKMAEKLLDKGKTITATGFDVHAFEDGSSVRLGGIDIPHDKSLKGHSDADIVLHAITDAILGCINEGDIGTHFPPTDPQWKDCDSAVFLNAAIEKLKNKNGFVDFIDVTIMAEEPKIGPHREAMQNRISDITNVDAGNISIKATTTEGLGFTGRKEGIACQCAVTLTRY